MELLRTLSFLLGYPTEERARALPEIEARIGAATQLRPERRRALLDLSAHLRASPELDAQETYVDLFDRTRSLSLHLYEHVHGDARERGQAMVELVELYRRAGFELASPELPDYLPVLLEFLSVVEDGAVREALLRDVAPLLALLASRLEGRASPYAAVFSALAELGGVDACPHDPEDLDPERESLEALDRAWAEEPVAFGLGAPDGGCAGAGAGLLDIDPPPRPARAGDPSGATRSERGLDSR